MAIRKRKDSLSRRIWELPFARMSNPADEHQIPMGLYSQLGAVLETVKVSNYKAEWPESITWGCLPEETISEEYISEMQEHFFGPFFYANYKWYLQTPHWNRIKKQIHNLRGSKCEQCSDTGELNVHHKTYKNVGREMGADLEILCRKCHLKHHQEKRERKEKERKEHGAKLALETEKWRAENITPTANWLATDRPLNRKERREKERREKRAVSNGPKSISGPA